MTTTDPAEAPSNDSEAPPEKGVENEKEKPPIPEFINLNEFQDQSLVELFTLGSELGLRVGGVRSKHQLVFEILRFYGKKGARIEATGVFEPGRDAFGFLRWAEYNFASTQDSIYLSPQLIKEFRLRPATKVKVLLRKPRDKDKYLSAESFLEIEDVPVESWEQPSAFDSLTPLSPRERLILEDVDTKAVGPRVVDIIAPLGKGQRGLICAPPRGGKTILLKDIAKSLKKNHPEVELVILLLDERPEEVTDFEENVDVDIYSSTFDENPARHIQVAELVSERAKRLVETGKDVVILLDSLTRLSRSYNAAQGGKGGILSGGIHKQALEKPRRFFGSARNVEDGGSLTILATALIETENRMDEVIFEEFKGTGNMEIQLDRELVERRVFPAIHIQKSATRKDDLLYHPDEFKRISMIRRQLSQVPAFEAMEFLIKNIVRTNTNAELLLTGLKEGRR